MVGIRGNQKSRSIYYFMAPFVIVMWSATFASSKVLLRSFEPESIMLFRFCIAWLGLFLLHPHVHRPVSWRDELLFLVLGATGCTFYFLAENTALQYGTTVTVGLVVAVAPLLTLWLVHIFDKSEPVGWVHWLGSLVSFVGVALISFNGTFHLAGDWRGYLLAILAALLWAVYSVAMRRVSHVYSSLYITRRTFFYAIVTLVPVMLLLHTEIDWSALLLPVNYLNVLFLGVFASCVAYVLWASIVQHLGAVTANNFIYLSPLLIVLIGIFVMHEKVTPWIVSGGVLILLGLYVSEHKK